MNAALKSSELSGLLATVQLLVCACCSLLAAAQVVPSATAHVDSMKA